ncbi:histidine kinase [Solirubrobacter taibaiensis]|nr:histidine kinase [Solirubrobacter taibaiensis]
MITGPRAAVGMLALSVAASIAAVPLLVIGADGWFSDRPKDILSGLGGAAFLLLGLTYACVGAVIARRVPENRIGLVFGITGVLMTASAVTWNYAIVDLHTEHHLPAPTAVMIANVVVGEWEAGWIALSLLLFPHGRVGSRRARFVLGVLATGMAGLFLSGLFRPGPFASPFEALSNPLGFGSRAAWWTINQTAWALIVIGWGAGVAALIVRLRRARGIERRQLKLVLAVGSLAAGFAALMMTTWFLWPDGALPARMFALIVTMTAFPLAVGAAILRRGLYGIDVAINRTLVYGSLTVVLAGAFAATTLLLGTWLGRGSPVAAATATLVVATAFRPLRARVQALVDRRLGRARYDALQRMAAFLEDLRSGRAAPEAVEGILRELVGDPSLELHVLAEQEYVDLRGAPAVERPGRVTVPIERGAQPLGQVVHAPLGAEQELLLRRLVEAGGLAIEIVRLRVELRRQLAEVQRSRARIVTAANAERRRIERDLHDGAQQRLVAIGLDLRHAQHQLDPSAPAGVSLDHAVHELAGAIEELRELARGLPPAQLDAGLAPAFRELALRAPVPVDVSASAERFAPGVEAAAYFFGCEAVTNAVKHAQASRIALSAERCDGRLVVAVVDDGIGGAQPSTGSGLTGLTDRIAALGGTLRIESAPGRGTALTAELPCAS